MSTGCSRAICARRQRSGLAVGAYHFYRFCKSGRRAGAQFPRGGAARPALLPPVVDIEFSGNCPDRPTSSRTAAPNWRPFSAIVEPAFGKQAIIYIIGEAEQTFMAQRLPDRRRWVSSLANHPGHENWLLLAVSQ